MNKATAESRLERRCPRLRAARGNRAAQIVLLHGIGLAASHAARLCRRRNAPVVSGRPSAVGGQRRRPQSHAVHGGRRTPFAAARLQAIAEGLDPNSNSWQEMVLAEKYAGLHDPPEGSLIGWTRVQE